MKRTPKRPGPPDPFETVRRVGLALPDVEAGTRYDGSPVLKVGGAFMAGVGTHHPAGTGEPLVRGGPPGRGKGIAGGAAEHYVDGTYLKNSPPSVRRCPSC